MKRATYHHNDLEAALLTAADELVAEKGVAGFSLREAARRVGVDPAACYRHFRDKEAVVQALARRGFTRLQAQFESALARKKKASAEEQLRVLARAYASFATEHAATFRVMFGPTGVDARDPVLRGDYPQERGPYGMLEGVVSAWSRQRKLRLANTDATIVLWAGLHGMVCLLIDGALRPANKSERAHLIDLMLAALVAGISSETSQPADAARSRR